MSPAKTNERSCGAGHDLDKVGTFKSRNGKGVGCIGCREKNERAKRAREQRLSGTTTAVRIVVLPAERVETFPLAEWKQRFPDEWDRINRAARTAGAYGQIEE